MTQVAISPASYQRMFPVVPGARVHARPAHLPSPLPTPDTPGLTSSSSSGLFSSVSTRLDTASFVVSPLSPIRFEIRSGEQKDHAVSLWEPSFPISPLFKLGLAMHQHQVRDYDGSNGIYERPVTVPPNTPSGNFPLDDNPSFLRRRRKPLPFLTKFMESEPFMALFDEEEHQLTKDGARPLAPVKSAFGEDGPEAHLAYDAWMDSCELHFSSLTKEERSRRVQSLKLQPMFDEQESTNSSPSSASSPRLSSLPRLNTNLSSGSKPSFQFLLSNDESLESARLRGAITLTISSPIYSAQSPASACYRDTLSKQPRRWTIGDDEDGVLSPRSALLSPMSAAASTGHGYSSFMETPSPSPVSSHPLRPSLPSLSDPSLTTTWQSARHAMLSCREIARSERHYLSSLRALLAHENSAPCLPAKLIRQHVPRLIDATEVFITAMGRDPSAQGVATAFLDNENTIRSAFTAVSQAIYGLDLTVMQSKALRDVIELPIDHVARYIFLFQDILSYSSTSSPSWSVIHAAVQAARSIASACNEPASCSFSS